MIITENVVETPESSSTDPPSYSDPPIVEYKKDRRSRRYMLVINNPAEHNINHETIKAALSDLTLKYWCMADEIGGTEHTYHTHIYLAAPNAMKFSTIKNHFPTANIEEASCFSNSTDCRNYVTKSGKWANTKKAETKVEGTFEEWGTLPTERQGARTDLEQLYQDISEGKSTAQILQSNPEHIMKISQIERARTTILEEKARTELRLDLEVTYICGETGCGKTRSLYETCQSQEISRITDYSHPFDVYNNQEDVLVFEEFRSSLPIGDMLSYLDIYPLTLPARYSNRIAAYHKVYIISNWNLEDQYKNIQQESPATWQAFLRRIHKVRIFTGVGEYSDYTKEEYFNSFHKIGNNTIVPFRPSAPKQEQMILYFQNNIEKNGGITNERESN